MEKLYFRGLFSFSFSASRIFALKVYVFGGPHFPAFELNIERYYISLRIQSKCGNIWSRITPNTDTFYTVIFAANVVMFHDVFTVTVNANLLIWIIKWIKINISFNKTVLNTARIFDKFTRLLEKLHAFFISNKFLSQNAERSSK